MKKFCERLLELRNRTPLTSQSALAAATGITERAVRNYETKDVQPRLDVAIRIADYFNVSLDYLAGRSDDPRRLP